MTDSNAGIWLLAGLAIVGLLILALPISAHGNGTAPHNETTVGTLQDMSDHPMAWMAEHTATQDTNASDWMGMSGLTNAGHAVHHEDHAHERQHATDEHDDHSQENHTAGAHNGHTEDDHTTDSHSDHVADGHGDYTADGHTDHTTDSHDDQTSHGDRRHGRMHRQSQGC